MTTTPETAAETTPDTTAMDPSILTDDERATVKAMLEGYDAAAYRQYLAARGGAWNIYQATHGRVRTVSRLMREGKPISSQLANELEALAAGDLTNIKLPAVKVPDDAKADGRPIDVAPQGSRRPARERADRTVERRRPRRPRDNASAASDGPLEPTDATAPSGPTGATGVNEPAAVADGVARPERMRRVKPPRNEPAREVQTLTAADVGQLPAPPPPARPQARRAPTQSIKARPSKSAKNAAASKRREEHGIPRNKRTNG